MDGEERTDEERVFSPRDVQGTAGLSSRQMNDWDARGALPHDRASGTAWRRYSSREVFTILTCAEIRRRFGVPVERLKWVQDFMLQDGADHLRVAMEMIGGLGLGVWIMTDCCTTFQMGSELDFSAMWRSGCFGPCERDGGGFILLNVDRLVQSMVTQLDLPPLKRPEVGAEVMQAYNMTPDEFNVIQMIRSGDYESVEVVTRDGTVGLTRAKSTRPDLVRSMESILGENDFETVTATKKDGKVVHVTKEVTVRPLKERAQKRKLN
jgi:hypothetical protein